MDELEIIKRKLELLDIIHDTPNYLDDEILTTLERGFFFRRSEVEGLYDREILNKYKYRSKRINLTQFEGLELYEVTDVTGYTTLDLVAELKKMYAREDELLDALRIIRDDLNEGMAQGHLPIESTHGVSARKIRNFANDASQ